MAGGKQRATAAEAPYHHGRLRAALVEEAAKLAAERGPDAVTLREVARRAGVSHAAPYHHFRDKREMLAAVAEEGFRRLDASMAKAMRGAPASPAERLRLMGLAYIRFAVSNPHYYRVMFKPELRGPSGTVDLNSASGRAFQSLLDAVAACRAEAGDPGADPLEWALLAWTLTHGVSSLWIEHALDCSPLAGWSIERIATAVAGMAAPVFVAGPARGGSPRRAKAPRARPVRRKG